MSNEQNEALVDESPSAFCSEQLVKNCDRRRFLIAGAGGMAASMLVPSLAFAAGNPVINQAGSASISAGQTCTWNTRNAADGRYSTLKISNSSRSNDLTIAISNAPGPGIVVMVNGQQQGGVNKIFTLPANSPPYALTAFGNFAGQAVKIVNMTDKSKDATARIECQA